MGFLFLQLPRDIQLPILYLLLVCFFTTSLGTTMPLCSLKCDIVSRIRARDSLPVFLEGGIGTTPLLLTFEEVLEPRVRNACTFSELISFRSPIYAVEEILSGIEVSGIEAGDRISRSLILAGNCAGILRTVLKAQRTVQCSFSCGPLNGAGVRDHLWRN